MAITPPLRPEDPSADTEGSAELRHASPVRGAALAAVAAALFLLVTLLVAGVEPGAPAFLRDALGPETKDAPLERSPAPGVDVSIDDDGYTVKRNGSSVSVEAEDTSGEEWERYAHGASRSTDFGTETIVVDGTSTESFLTVTEHQGRRTWRWKLGTRLLPRIGRDGGVSFFDPTRHREADIGIDPAAILDSDGKDITPEGLGWDLVLDRGEWWLTLELNDAGLPLPYVIDPAANYPTPLNLRSTTSSFAGTWTMNSGTGAVDTSTDNTPARNATGWYPWDPGLSSTTQLASLPTVPDNRGWVIDPVGGASGFPAGNWSFTIVTGTPGAFTAGAAVLTVGVWKMNSSGVVTGTILSPTDDPAGQDLRPNNGVNATTVTYALPAFSLATSETLYVEFWRHQTQGINTNQAARRTLEFHVNDGAAYIAHPPADDTAPAHSLSVVELTNAGGQHFDASTGTHYYSTAAGGTFRVDDAATDAGSGVAQGTFPALSLTGFTHTAVADGTSPYQSNTYTWTTANTTSPGIQAIVAADNALNASSPSPAFTITRDVTAPGAFSLTAPTAGAAIRNGQTISAAPSDAGAGLASVEFRYCPGATCTYAAGTTIGSPDTSAPYSVTWNSQPADGTYTLLARATDNVGNTTDSAQRTITVDNTAPGSSLSVNEGTRPDLQHFVPGADTLYYNPAATGDFTVSDAASDASGVASVDFPALTDTGFTGAAKSDPSSPFDSNAYTFTSASASAPSPLTVVVADSVGNTTNDALTFVRDVTGPGAFSLTAPTAGAAIRNGQTVSASPSDAGAGLASVEFRYCPGATCTYAAGTTIGAPDTSAPYSLPWNSQPADGTYTLLARATDNVGNTTDSAQRTITVDNGDPSAVFDFPAAASAYKAAGWNAGCPASGFCGTASDATSGVAGVEISIERESSGLYWSGGSFSIAGESFLPATLAGSSWSYAFPASSFPADGDYTVHVRATDVAGNVEAGPSRTV